LILLFNFVVLVNLSIEGDGPGKEIDPANNVDYRLLGLVGALQHQDIYYSIDLL
jgi:hypothetical protein